MQILWWLARSVGNRGSPESRVTLHERSGAGSWLSILSFYLQSPLPKSIRKIEKKNQTLEESQNLKKSQNNSKLPSSSGISKHPKTGNKKTKPQTQYFPDKSQIFPEKSNEITKHIVKSPKISKTPELSSNPKPQGNCKRKQLFHVLCFFLAIIATFEAVCSKKKPPVVDPWEMSELRVKLAQKMARCHVRGQAPSADNATEMSMGQQCGTCPSGQYARASRRKGGKRFTIQNKLKRYGCLESS